MLSLRVALRFLRKSPVQSILIAAGIAVGLGVQVFVGSLIISLQQNLVDQTIGSAPQLWVTSPDQGKPVTYTTAVRDALKAQPQITTIAPSLEYSGIYRRGNETAPLGFTGGSLTALDSIYDLTGKTIAGSASVGLGEVILGKDFVETYGLKPGDRTTFVLPDGTQADLTISAVVDLGSAAANKASAFVGEEQARTVLGFAADQYSSIDTQLSDVFASKTVAQSLAQQPALKGYMVTEWQSQNADLLSALKAQSSSSYMVQFFVLVAVALGIASTLAISAVQKTRQIGILKAMGMQDGRAGRVFLWQAAILGLCGAAVGVGAGLGLIAVFNAVASSASFPIQPQLAFTAISFVVGILVALASSIIPWRRTSKLDPIEVIQSG
jgi:lipoprotein-releasing system permease protein